MKLLSFQVRYLRKILQWPIDGFEIKPEEARKGLEYLGPTKRSDKAKAFKGALRARKSTKIAKRKMTRNQIRDVVHTRADGACEAAPYRETCIAHYGALEWDHWHGGSGDRQKRETIATTWLPCHRCHKDRTLNYPSAAYWNNVFELHCQRHGYRFTPHVEHKPLPRRTA